MNKIVGILLVLLISLLVLSCNKEESNPTAPTTGTISGKVTNATGDTLIAGATVTTNPPTSSVTTNSTGDYKISNVSPGTYTITASKGGYLPGSVTVNVTAGNTTPANIPMNLIINHPPNVPTVLSPLDGATNQTVSLTLRWRCTDPDADALTYDVYFDKNNPPITLVSSNQVDTSLARSALDTSATYYWRVTAKDNKGATTTGNVWRFTTTSINTGHFIVFERDEEIFKANIDGSNITSLTNNSNVDAWPKISPDRSKIGFVSNRTGQYQVFTMDVNGTNPQQITTTACLGGQYGTGGGTFDWLSNNKIVFTNATKLYTIDLDGTNLTQIATSPSGSYYNIVVTSPNGSKIAASNMRPWAYNVQIYIMNSDGTNMTLLVPDNPGMTNVCSFTTDGSKVVYFYDVSGHEESSSKQLDDHIFLINLDGSNNTDISINKPTGYNDDFSTMNPDGNKVIFRYQVNTYSLDSDIWIMNIDGTNRTQLFTNGGSPNCK